MFKRLRRATEGASAVEFALVLPLILLTIFGLYEFGRLFWIQNSLQFAAEQTGRYAMANKTATTTQLHTQFNSMLVSVNPAAINFATAASSTTSAAGVTMNYVTITATYTFQFVTGFPFTTGVFSGSAKTFPNVVLTGQSKVPLL